MRCLGVPAPLTKVARATIEHDAPMDGCARGDMYLLGRSAHAPRLGRFLLGHPRRTSLKPPASAVTPGRTNNLPAPLLPLPILFFARREVIVGFHAAVILGNHLSTAYGRPPIEPLGVDFALANGALVGCIMANLLPQYLTTQVGIHASACAALLDAGDTRGAVRHAIYMVRARNYLRDLDHELPALPLAASTVGQLVRALLGANRACSARRVFIWHQAEAGTLPMLMDLEATGTLARLDAESVRAMLCATEACVPWETQKNAQQQPIIALYTKYLVESGRSWFHGYDGAMGWLAYSHKKGECSDADCAMIFDLLMERTHISAVRRLLQDNAGGNDAGLRETLGQWMRARQTGKLAHESWARCVGILFREPTDLWLPLSRVITDFVNGRSSRDALPICLALEGATHEEYVTLLLAHIEQLWHSGRHPEAIQAMSKRLSAEQYLGMLSLRVGLLQRFNRKTLCTMACEHQAWSVCAALLADVNLPNGLRWRLSNLLEEGHASSYSAQQLHALVDIVTQIGRDTIATDLPCQDRTHSRGIPWERQRFSIYAGVAHLMERSLGSDAALLDTLHGWLLARRSGRLSPAAWTLCICFVLPEPQDLWMQLSDTVNEYVQGRSTRHAFHLTMAQQGATRTCHTRALGVHVAGLLHAGRQQEAMQAIEGRLERGDPRLVPMLTLDADIVALCKLARVHEAWNVLNSLLQRANRQEPQRTSLQDEMLTELQQVPTGVELNLSQMVDSHTWRVATLPAVHQQTLARLHDGSFSYTTWGEPRSVGDSFAVMLALARNDRRHASAYVNAWRAAHEARQTSLFSRFEAFPNRLYGLNSVLSFCEGSPLGGRALLLAMCLQSVAGNNSCLLQPRMQHLLTSKFVLKSARRLRSIFRVLAFLQDTRAASSRISQLLAWPDDEQLGELFTGALKEARQKVQAGYKALDPASSDAPQASLPQLYSQAEDLATLVSLHSLHTLRCGQRAALARYRQTVRADLDELAQQLQGVAGVTWHGSGALLPLVQSIKAKLHGCSPDQAAQRHVLKHQLHVASQAMATHLTQHQLSKPETFGSTEPWRDFFVRYADRQEVATYHHQTIFPAQMTALGDLGILGSFKLASTLPASVGPAHLRQQVMTSLNLRETELAGLRTLLHRFRRPELFWTFYATMRGHGEPHNALFNKLLKAVLNERYDAFRGQSPQMRAIFAARRERQALRAAWEAGARDDQAIPGFVLVDTADVVDLLSSGDEVSGSCQSVYNTRSQLLGRLIDGSKRMLALKRLADGTLYVRAMFRLMGDGRAPVLLLSSLYTRDGAPKGAETALKTFALQRGAALRLNLVSNVDKGQLDTPFERPLTCYKAAVEEFWDESHSDSGAVITIHSARLMGTPQRSDPRNRSMGLQGQGVL